MHMYGMGPHFGLFNQASNVKTKLTFLCTSVQTFSELLEMDRLGNCNPLQLQGLKIKEMGSKPTRSYFILLSNTSLMYLSRRESQSVLLI